MKHIKTILAATFLLFASNSNAQQEPMISQYMTNAIFLNPAYAGSHPYATLSALYRKQWVNFPGAPTSGFLTFDKRFENTKTGLGITLVNDKIGVTDQTDLALNYAYHLQLGKGQLSLGLRGMLSYYNARLTDLTVWDNNDAVFINNIKGRIIPNFGAGAYYYTDRFYAGISVPRLLKYQKPSAAVAAEISRLPNYEQHYYVAAGYVMNAGEDIYFKPSFLLKYVPDAPVNVDLNLNVFFKNWFSVGASLRTDGELVGMLEVSATNRLRIGYAYDLPLNRKLVSYSNGTHEIMMAYDFGELGLKMKSPRFF